MPRARNVKPGFFANEKLAELDAWGRLLFIGLWTLADRAGRIEYRPARIKAQLFPFDAVDVAAHVDALAMRGFVTLYDVQGVALLQVDAFEKHQNPHHREPQSTLPAPPKAKGNRPRARPRLALVHPGAGPGLDLGQPGAGPADSGFLIPDSGFRIPENNKEGEAVEFPDWLDVDAWAMWERFRSKGKGRTTWTEDARRLSLRTLGKLRDAGHDPRAVIEQSIERGWSGLFELKGQDNGRRGKGAADLVADAVRRTVARGEPQ
jgi:hypothetical protein